jgi:hypothetical protein
MIRGTAGITDRALQSRGPLASSFWSRRAPHIVFLGILVLFVVARVRDLGFTLWIDEVFSVTTARMPWRDLIDWAIGDIVHPPLFYVLLKSWILVGGESLRWMRLLPILITVMSVIPFYGLCQALGLCPHERNLAFFFIACNWFLVWHAADLRMYSLLLFFTVCSLWLLLLFIRSPRPGLALSAALVLVNIGLVYSHYYGGLVVAVELAYVVLTQLVPNARRKLLVFSATVLLVVGSFIPWAMAVMTSLEKLGGLHKKMGFFARPGWGDIVAFYGLLNGIFMWQWRYSRWLTVVGVALFGFPIVALAVRLVLKARKGAVLSDRDWAVCLLLAMAVIPVGISFVLSHTLDASVFQTRSLIIVAVPYLLVVAISASQLRPSWLKQATAVVLVIWASLAGLQGATRQKFSWGHLVEHIRRKEPVKSSERPILVLTIPGYLPVQYYLKEAGDTRFTLQRVKRDRLEDSLCCYENVWVTYMDSAYSGKRYTELPEEAFRAHGYVIGDRFEDGSEGHKIVAFRACRGACDGRLVDRSEPSEGTVPRD